MQTSNACPPDIFLLSSRRNQGAVLCSGLYSPSDGRTEKSLAARYKENADYLSTIYPKTAKIYYRLCDRYKYEAKWERERAENGVY
jgi:hypothetical protein